MNYQAWYNQLVAGGYQGSYDDFIALIQAGDVVTYEAGMVTAYGAAVEGGYTGTYADFCAQQAQYAENAAYVADTMQALEHKLDAVTPGTEALLEQIEQAAASAPAELTAVTGSIASLYNGTATYKAGDYCFYNDSLYRCKTAIDTPEPDFVAAHWEKAKMADDMQESVADLKSALGDFTPTTTTQFSSTDRYSINSLGKIQSAGSARLDYGVYCAPVENSKRYKITAHDTSGDYVYSFFNDVPTTSSAAYNNTRYAVSDPFFVAPINGYVAFRSSFTMTDEAVTFVTANDVVARAGIAALDGRIDGVDAHVDAVEGMVNDVLENAMFTEDVDSSDYTLHNDVFIKADGSETQSELWQYAEYAIPSNATKLIVAAYAGQTARLWVLKNDSGTVVGYSSDTSSVNLKTEVIDLANYVGATKLFVNDRKSGSLSISYQYVTKKINGDDVYVGGVSLSEAIASTNPLEGKILVCVGDSITAGADMDSPGYTNNPNITVYKCDTSGVFSQQTTEIRMTYGYQIASRNHMTFYNGGVSGSTMQGLSDRNGFSLENGRYTKLPDNLDYLLIWFGWNDNAYGTLGAITDTTNESYYGGYNVVLPYLINKYPYAKIGLIVPFGATAGHREAVRLLGDKWGLAVWDNYQGGTPLYFGKESSVGVEESVVTANRAKFQANGAHPNYKGHAQLADMIEAWLKSI